MQDRKRHTLLGTLKPAMGVTSEDKQMKAQEG